MLTRHHVELIEIPQRMGVGPQERGRHQDGGRRRSSCRFERDYITTFVLGTGDSDFTPLVHKLRELNRRVIGIGIEASTSALLPPACDEFLFYERLEGVEPSRRSARAGAPRRTKRAPAEADVETEAQPTSTARSEPVAAEEADLGVARHADAVRASNAARVARCSRRC